MKRIVSGIVSFIEGMAHWSALLCASLIVFMALLVTYEVVLRYVFRKAPMIADEFSAYILVTLVFIGLAYTMQTKTHVRVEAVTNLLPPKVRNWVRLFTLLVFLAYAIVLLPQGWALVLRSRKWGLVSETHLLTPEWIPQLVVPLGLALLILYLLLEVARAVRTVIRSAPSDTQRLDSEERFV